MVYGRYRSSYSSGYTATDKTEGYHLVAPPVLGGLKWPLLGAFVPHFETNPIRL